MMTTIMTMIIENDQKSDRSDSDRFGLDREHNLATQNEFKNSRAPLFLATVIENLSTDYLLIVQIISCCKWRVIILKLEPHFERYRRGHSLKRTFTVQILN